MDTLAPASSEALAERDERIRRLERRLERERAARVEAEAIAERGLRDLYERGQYLSLLERIATQANQSEIIDEALRFAIGAIRLQIGAAVGNVYLRAADDPTSLVPSGLVESDDADGHNAFLDESNRIAFAHGHGLPGRVLASARAVWIRDVTTDTNFLRTSSARQAGLRSAFAFPVLVGADVVAVFEFFFREANDANDGLLGLASQIGSQLGRVMEREQARRRLIFDASHDALTGLPNRLGFLQEAGSLFKAAAASGLPLSILFIDLDRFKLVNDSLGHAIGDALLVAVAHRFRRVLGELSGQGTGMLLAKFAADEFVVLVDGSTMDVDTLIVADRLRDALREPMQIGEMALHTSASIGVAIQSERFADVADLLRAADIAMYRAKEQGRSRVECFDHALQANVATRLQTEGALRQALRSGEFELHYQPIVPLETRRVIGFEALVRWRRSTGELVAPGDFISVAEDTGLIIPLGDWVMREAIAALGRWQSGNPDWAGLTMSINVSARQFQQVGFADRVLGIVQSSGVAPSTIRLELTESITVQDAGWVRATLERFRQIGVGISLDDFGTGYSSLSYLQTLPFDTLKIDRSFVSRMDGVASSEPLVRAVVAMAHSLGMSVVAEGIETEAEAERLQAMQCRYGQGYLFSRPLPELEVTNLLIASGSTVTPD
ncbi:bifunctional diguanylate cyclase/phosphodiesterase [Aureimonas sp. AU4]|uniref:putative bifunctional diguanylate cyclase/phosphodiesterase n=1 Tax=Aureimonas sp. AU4 TaxID=1638163 RepID=UPI0007063CD5|nr:GGDEF domain-containing protein [Aureimonas sp. AU4]BAT30598.1 diguanylate cyclase/phosphodiesterase with PAS/PAC and GAF sensor [Aureimonas sp. AU4]